MLISIDLSSKPGFAVWHYNDGCSGDEPCEEGWELDHYETLFPEQVRDSKGKLRDKGTQDYGSYPMNFIKHAEDVIDRLLKAIAPFVGSTIEYTTFIVEETTASKNNYSQKTLEYLHYILNKRLSEGRKNEVIYIRTGIWKKAVGATQNSEERKHNAKVRRLKAKTGGKLAKDENGKVIGKKSRKHYSVRAANEIFGLDLKLKDNDTADAILLGYAYTTHKLPVCDGTVKGGLNASEVQEASA